VTLYIVVLEEYNLYPVLVCAH